MKTILCCTDGSLYAPSVYDHTIWAARRTNAEVVVLHMLDPQRDVSAVHDFSGNLEPDEGEELMKEMVALEEAKSKVANAKGRMMLKAARQHFEAAGMPDIRAEQRHGTLVETLEKIDGDFVVIGKRGENVDFARLHLGANLERVIRSSHRPVLVASRAFQEIDRWVLAFDGSASAHKAVAFAASQALLREVPCLLLSVGKESAWLEKEIEKAREGLESTGTAVTTRVVPGEPEKVIPDVIEKEKIPLLAMGAYGHSRIRHLIVGSTTTEMVRTCRVPVLLFR